MSGCNHERYNWVTKITADKVTYTKVCFICGKKLDEQSVPVKEVDASLIQEEG
jgi:hypothetical protein